MITRPAMRAFGVFSRPRQSIPLTLRAAVAGALIALVPGGCTAIAAPQPAIVPAPGVPAAPPVAQPLTVQGVTLHRAAGVHSLWLSNNIRLHVRPMPGSPGVSLCIRVLGGELHETEATRGLTAAAAGAWQPDSAAARPLLVTVGAESITMRYQGDGSGLSRSLQYAATLLKNPVANESRWPAVLSAALARAQRGPLSEGTTLNAALGGAQDLRALPARVDVVKSWNVRDADRWLKRVLAESPIEMAIAGDITLEQARALVLEHMAGVRSAARVSGETHASLRASLPRVGGGVALVKGFRPPRGIVHLSLPGPDTGDLRAVREATLACAIIKERLNALLEGAADASMPRGGVIAINPSPSRALTGQGTIFLTLRIDNADNTDRQRAQLLSLVERALASITEPQGLGGPQFARAVQSVSDEAQTRLKVPDYWAVVLSFADFYALSPDALATPAEEYRSITPDQVRASVARMGGAESVRFAVMAPARPADEARDGGEAGDGNDRPLPTSTAGDRPQTPEP
jgi:hypothetical protein